MPKTIQRLLEQATKNIAAMDAHILLAHVLGVRREHLIAHPEENVRSPRAWLYRLLVFRRHWGVPIAYLTGHKEFYGLDFFVNRNVLIPRPETELLVDLAIQKINSQLSDVSCQMLLVDVGTGSACIPIAIMKALKHENIKAVATDFSKNALGVAERNATRHGVTIAFLQGNLLEPFLKDYGLQTTDYRHVIITANLPYLTPEQYTREPSIQYEPRPALVAGPSGLERYEQLLQQIKTFVKSHVSNVMCFFEIDPSQSSRMRELVTKHLPNSAASIHKDLCGRDRIVVVETKPS